MQQLDPTQLAAMQIWFHTQWLGYSDRRPTPLWRHPEISLLDWLCQLLMPFLLPLKRIVAEVCRTGVPTRIVTIREQLVATELKGHDKLFADWSASVIELARSDGSTLLVHLHRPPAHLPRGSASCSATGYRGGGWPP